NPPNSAPSSSPSASCSPRSTSTKSISPVKLHGMTSTISSNLHIIAPDPQKHGEEMMDLLAKSFGCYSDHFPVVQQDMRNDPFYSYPASRIGILDGKIVTHFGVYEYQ